MTTDLGAPPAPPSRREQSPVVSVLVAVATVAACLAFDRLVAFHLVPKLAPHWPHSLDTALGFVVVVAPFALLAAILAIWGLDARHRWAGAVCALLAGVSSWGIQYGYQKLFFERGHVTQTSLRVFDWTMTLLIPTLLALAWGLARRTGRTWVLGVAVAPALAWVQRSLQLHSTQWQEWQFRHDSWWLHRLEYIAPAIVAAVVCWLIERAEIGSSA